MSRRIIHIIKATLATVFLLPHPAAAEVAASETPRFCIVPVSTNIPDQATKPDERDRSFEIQVPGMPSPIFGHPGSAYSIGPDFSLRPYLSPFPNPDVLFAPKPWVEDPWNARILGIEVYPPLTVLEMRRGEGQFHILYQDHVPSWELQKGVFNFHFLDFIGIAPKQKQIVFSSLDGGVFTIDHDKLVPWPNKSLLFGNDVAGVTSVGYDPSLGITLIDDANITLHIWSDDGQWYDVGQTTPKFDQVVDLPGVGVAGINDGRVSFVVLHDPANKTSPYTRLYDEKGWFSDFEFAHISEQFEQILRYNTDFSAPDSGHWQLLTTEGYKDIPGGAAGLNPAVSAFPKYLSVIGRSVIEGGNAWYFYDGHAITPIPGSGPDIIGPDIYVPDTDGSEIFDLKSIGHVLVASSIGVFEITQDARVVRRPHLDDPIGSNRFIRFFEWSEPGLALEETGEGIFIIDKNLNKLNDEPLQISPLEIGGSPQQIIWGYFAPLHGLVGRVGTSGIGILVDSALAGHCPPA